MRQRCRTAPGADHVAPLSELRATRMSAIFEPGESGENQTATQLPCPSVAISGSASERVSLSKYELSAAGVDHVAPLSVLRLKKISKSVIIGGFSESQTATQVP